MYAQFKKTKFIFITRDALDVIPSIYQQTKDYIDPTTNFDQLCARNMTHWFQYNAEWIENKNELSILYLNYEDVVKEKKKMISSISKFLEINIDAQSLERVIERSSFEFMKKHESKFGEQPEHWKVYTNFIRHGKVGEGKIKFTDDQLKQYTDLSTKYKIEGTILQRYFALET